MASFVAKTGKRIWGSDSVKSLLSESQESDPVEAMRTKAAALIERCELDGPPIDHEMVASFRGIQEVRPAKMKESGALIPLAQGEFLVLVNERDSKPRQRFSCKHEISHTLFPNYIQNPSKKSDMSVGEYGIDAEEEYLCDVGAAELLMPRKFFHPHLQDRGCAIEVISELAHLYEASLEAVAVQMVQSALHECAIIVWHSGHTPTQTDILNSGQCFFEDMDDWTGVPKKLRTRYALATPNFDYFFPKDKSVELNSPIHHCYLTGKVCKGETAFHDGKSFKHYHTESIFIPIKDSDGCSEGKVITIVMPQQNSRTRN